MFPVSITCLVVAFVIGGLNRRRVLVSLAIFLAISGPYVVVLSVAKGRITFGDSGLYNYAVHVNNIPRAHWQGEPGDFAGGGQPLHPTRRILIRPATFEFQTPIGGIYPAWTDPTYWYEGVRTPFNLRRALSTELKLLNIESLFFFSLHGSLFAGIFVLLYATGRKWSVLKDVSTYWFLIIPCLGTLAMYALIHTEPRYLAPFLVGFLLSLFFAAHLPASNESRRLCSAVAILMLVMYFVPVESPSLNITGFARDLLGRSHADPDSPQQVVKGMQGLGLRPGDNIASLEYSLYGMSTWARLARVKIVAEVFYWPDLSDAMGNDFWKADSATQERIIEALARTGATFIVSQFPPPVPDVPGWQRVGSTHYYAYQVHAANNLSSQR